MTTYQQGAQQYLTVLFLDSNGDPLDVDTLQLTSVINLTSGVNVLGPIVSGFGHPQPGTYNYLWSIPVDLVVGQYLVTWSATVSGDPLPAQETITVTTPNNGTYSPSGCGTWPVIWPRNCDLTGVSPEITGAAAEAATEMLYQLTAQRFGLCTVALRPCREECYGNGSLVWGGWWQYGTYPQPYWYNGVWYNMGCGQCTNGCSCMAISETLLPGPVNEIISVKVDGVTLVPGADYRVDDYRKLVRLGGAVWPYCNDLSKTSADDVGTWEVVASYGEPIPTLGKLAMGEIACQMVDFLTGGDCGLPPGVTEVSRQGVTLSLANTTLDLTQLYARYPIAYQFIKTYNPYNLMSRSAAYDLDGPDFRAVNT